MHHAPSLSTESESNGHERVAAVPWRSRWVGCGQAVLYFVAVRKNLNCANAAGRTRTLALALLGVEFAVDENGTLAGDHLTLPLASSSQIGWSRDVTLRSAGNASLTSSPNVRSVNFGGVSSSVFFET